jgi:hypothetical protein
VVPGAAVFPRFGYRKTLSSEVKVDAGNPAEL